MYEGKPFTMVKLHAGTNNYRSMSFSDKRTALKYRDRLNEMFKFKKFKVVELNL